MEEAIKSPLGRFFDRIKYMSRNKKITITLFVIAFLLIGAWLSLDSRTKNSLYRATLCKLIYGKNICNFYEMMDIMAYDHPNDADFNKAMQLCRDMENVPKKDGCFEYVAEVISFWDFEKARQACDEVVGYKLVYYKDRCYQKIQISREESPFFEVIERVPEGTESGFVQEDKVVQGPLDGISIAFSRNIDENTLTKENFYALQGIGEKVPGTIEYKEETRTASLIFNQGIKGGEIGRETRITVIIEGVRDLEGNQIESLLYNIDIIQNDQK